MGSREDTASGTITGITRAPSFIEWDIIAPIYALVWDYEQYGRDDDASIIAGRIPRDGQPAAPVITFGNLRALIEAALAPSFVNSGLAVVSSSQAASDPAPPVATSERMGRSGTTPAGGAGEDVFLAELLDLLKGYRDEQYDQFLKIAGNNLMRDMLADLREAASVLETTLKNGERTDEAKSSA